MSTESWISLAFFTGWLIGLISNPQQSLWFMLGKSGMLVPGHAITAGELKRVSWRNLE